MSETVPVGIGIVGFGYWGPKLLRNFQNARSTRPVAVCEANPERRRYAFEANPQLQVVESLDELLRLDTVEAVAIATPVTTHYPIARQALLHKKHVFVEKPFTAHVDEAIDLIRIGRQHSRIIMVDHTFTFTAAVRKLRELMRQGEIGELLYYDSIRINLGLFQPDVDVIWDLAPHDFAILDFVLERRPLAISAIGACHSPSGHSDVAYVTLDFGRQVLGHLHLNWIAPMKVRQILIGGSKRMITYNDVLVDEKVRIYNRGFEIAAVPKARTITADDREGRYQGMFSYRTGDMSAPWLDRTEALFLECEAFGKAVRENLLVQNDSFAGLRVMLMLEAATRSVAERGRFVPVAWDRLAELGGDVGPAMGEG